MIYFKLQFFFLFLKLCIESCLLFVVGIAAGSFVIVEMLYSSDLLAIVGAGEQVCA